MDAQLDERKVTILKAIIKTYLETGEPVGSRTISKYSELKLRNVVGTPGSGFGPSGEGYFRLTAFNTYENTVEAVERMKALRK